MLIREGYGGKTPEQFLEAVKAHQPDLVVDARYQPFTRKRGFAGYELRRTFGAAGIRYEHWKGLGNRLYKSRGQVLIADGEAITRIHHMAETQAIVLVCACATDAPGCHIEAILKGEVGQPALL